MIQTRFRIFRKGLNSSTKGSVLFDDKAAKSVMAEYTLHGADLMLDLEHLSLDDKAPNYDPDARGWFQLAVENGELWAVNARYTPEGLARLQNKTQRYISPAFNVDKQQRVVSILNAALCAMPATDKPMALVAANASGALCAFSTIGYSQMDLSALIQLLGLPDGSTLDQIVEAVKALQSGSATPVAASEPGEGGATAAPVTESAAPAMTAPVTPKKTTVSIQHTSDAAAVLELSQTVASLQAERTAEKRLALIKLNAGKLTPVLERWALTQSIETLTTFFSAAAPQEQIDTEAVRTTQGATTEVSLTQAEIDLCRDTNTDPKSVLAYKQKEAANRGTR